MKLKVLGSGSSGNCYILESDTEALIVEAGLPFKEVKKALDFNIRKIVGVVVSHSHGDHAKYVAEYEKAGMPVFKPYESELEKQVRTYGDFVITSFPLIHDVPCCGFHLFHEDIGTLIYASDTEYIKYRFKGLNHILVEANYSKDLISDIPQKRRHVLTGHMEISTTCGFLEKNRSPALQNVILLHLSGDSADAEDFKDKAERAVNCPVYVARKGLSVSMNLIPF